MGEADPVVQDEVSEIEATSDIVLVPAVTSPMESSLDGGTDDPITSNSSKLLGWVIFRFLD